MLITHGKSGVIITDPLTVEFYCTFGTSRPSKYKHNFNSGIAHMIVVKE